jgi:stearoyl-CoA desaturase (delta-9 desaturase)
MVSKTERRHVVSWVTTIALGAFHVLTLIAFFFFFDWTAIAAASVLMFVALSWGIGMGYHRLHTHRGYKVPKPLEYFLAICGTIALEGGPIFWVAVHRIHHQRSDQPGDPHSPRDGGWWAHMLWMIFGDGLHNKTDVLGKYAPDLYREPFYRFLNTWHWVPLTLLGFVLLAIGGWSWVMWGVFARVTLGLHFTWLVNSATHMWGSRRFGTRDDSRNLWWVALLTFGEGWHNNHHAHPTSARHGLAWYELDITWLQIRLLEKLGIARAVHVADTEGTVELRQAA